MLPMPSNSHGQHLRLGSSRHVVNEKVLLGRFPRSLPRELFFKERKGLFARIPYPIQRTNDTYAREENNEN